MSPPLVTIGIPTFNRAGSYLQDVVHAALNQTYQNIEVVVADNSSTDDTQDVVRQIGDHRLTYYRHDRNVGPISNMNFLLWKARGRFFQLLPDDDQIDPDFVEVCIDAVGQSGGPGVIMTGSRVIDSHGHMLRQRENEYPASTLEEVVSLWYQRRIHLFLCSTLFNTGIMREVGGFEATFANFNDVAAELKCIARGGCTTIRDVKAGLRVHDSSISKSTAASKWCDSSVALAELAVSLVSPARRAEIAEIAYRVSALRNYQLAKELPDVTGRWKACLTVLWKFGFRYWPDRHTMMGLVR